MPRIQPTRHTFALSLTTSSFQFLSCALPALLLALRVVDTITSNRLSRTKPAFGYVRDSSTRKMRMPGGGAATSSWWDLQAWVYCEWNVPSGYGVREKSSLVPERDVVPSSASRF